MRKFSKTKKSERTFWNEIDQVKNLNLEIHAEILTKIHIIAALKCRQRKKQWVANLQTRVDYLTTDNEQLQLESEALRKEIIELKTLLLAHKDCPHYLDALKASNIQQPFLYNQSIPM